MSENYWEKQPKEEELDPISSFLAEWTDPEAEEDEFRSDFFQGLSGRRKKSALILTVIWSAVILLHLLSWGYWLVMILTGLVSIHLLRFVTTTPEKSPQPLTDKSLNSASTVSLLVSAKNEEAVIGNLIEMLGNLDYPQDKYEVWAIDDRSSDRTR